MGNNCHVFLAGAFYILTVVILSLALVSLAQGFLFQMYKELGFAFLHYFMTVLIILVSFVFYKKAHKKRLDCK